MESRLHLCLCKCRPLWRTDMKAVRAVYVVLALTLGIIFQNCARPGFQVLSSNSENVGQARHLRDDKDRLSPGPLHYLKSDTQSVMRKIGFEVEDLGSKYSVRLIHSDVFGSSKSKEGGSFTLEKSQSKEREEGEADLLNLMEGSCELILKEYDQCTNSLAPCLGSVLTELTAIVKPNETPIKAFGLGECKRPVDERKIEDWILKKLSELPVVDEEEQAISVKSLQYFSSKTTGGGSMGWEAKDLGSKYSIQLNDYNFKNFSENPKIFEIDKPQGADTENIPEGEKDLLNLMSGSCKLITKEKPSSCPDHYCPTGTWTTLKVVVNPGDDPMEIFVLRSCDQQVNTSKIRKWILERLSLVSKED